MRMHSHPSHIGWASRKTQRRADRELPSASQGGGEVARDWMAQLRNKLGAALLQAEVLSASGDQMSAERAEIVLRNVKLAVESLEGLDRALLDPEGAQSPLAA